MSAAYTRDTPIWRIGETKCIVGPMRVLGQPRRRGGIGAFTGRRSRRRDPGGIDRRVPALVVIEAGSCTRSLRSSEHGDAGTALALAGVQEDPATVAAARVRARLRPPRSGCKPGAGFRGTADFSSSQAGSRSRWRIDRRRSRPDTRCRFPWHCRRRRRTPPGNRRSRATR